MHIADLLTQRIVEKKAPIVVGLDPVIERIPDCFKRERPNTFAGCADTICAFNRAVIDAVAAHVPVVKPQMAFYEMYGAAGVRAFEDTARYTKEKGLVVIEDAKRNDIGNTAKAYASGHLGAVRILDGEEENPYQVDFLTVSPFLGFESLDPFVEAAIENNRGIFILVKTSNPGSGTVQNVKMTDGRTVSEAIADYIDEKAEKSCGASGYSAIGAVVGATYPQEAKSLRQRMLKSYFLVPGYGTQGGGAAESLPNFNPDGLGAVVSASRSVLFAYEKMHGYTCTEEQFLQSVEDAVLEMEREIYSELKRNCPDMRY